MKKRRLKKGVKRTFRVTLLLLLFIICYPYYSQPLVDFFVEESKIVVKKDNNKQEPVDKSLFKDYTKEAEKLVQEMTLEEKVGQVFLARYDNTKVDELNTYYPGGYILFAKDFEYHSKDSIKSEIDHDQETSKYPLIIGVDEEGGTVTRVSRYESFRHESFLSPRDYYDLGGYELLEQIEKEKAELLLSIGVNLNLAPVADISTNPDDFIYSRSFGFGVDETSEYIKKMIQYSNNNKINSCLKHFPGYGNNTDTHTGIAEDYRDYENFLNNDYKPFEAGIEEGVPCVLVSHNIIMNIDNEYPASLSQKVISELRDKLGFTGIIITDDLAMSAVSSYVSDGKAALLAIKAGCDMIITSDFISMRDEIINAINNNEIDEEVLNKAVTRVIAWKYYSNLFDS